MPLGDNSSFTRLHLENSLIAFPHILQNKGIFMLSLLRTVAFLPLAFVIGCKATAEIESTDLSPQPPIWVVSDADSEITLYPTLHIMPENVSWKSDELSKRLAEADEVWFEIMPGSEADPALQMKTIELGMAPGSSVSSNMSEEEVAALKELLTPLGVPFEAADSMRPWMLSTMASVGLLVDNGFDPSAGVEKQLLPMTEGKKIRALETAESQLQMLASIPDEVQLNMLKDMLGEMDETVTDLQELVKDWSVGDVADLENELLDEMKAEYPAAFNAIFTQRNKNWVDQIEIEMNGSGTDFIAVGAGHLVGEDGVPAMLKARGYDVKRL